MTVRTTGKTVTFMHPFNLSGTDEVQPAGTYTVETDEELLQPSSPPAYRRISTLTRLPSRSTGTVLTQIVRGKSWGTRGGPSERRTAGRNSAAAGSQRRCCASGKGGRNPSVKAGNTGLPSTPLI
jgi:hypothetical protein